MKRPRWKKVKRFKKGEAGEQLLVLMEDYRGIMIVKCDEEGKVKFPPRAMGWCYFPKKGVIR